MKISLKTASAVTLLVIAAAGAWVYFIWPVAQAKDHVRSALVDPESAQFKDVRYFRQTGSTCGWVNARNRMGGYVGFSLFIAKASGEVEMQPKSTKDVLRDADEHLAFVRNLAAHCPTN